jgi:hypothetical protein
MIIGELMKTFKEWLIFESKGIRLPNEVLEQINSSINKIHQVALEVKKEPGKEVFDVATISYKNPYVKDKFLGNKDHGVTFYTASTAPIRNVQVHVVNNKHDFSNGSHRIGYGIEINVAHVEEKDLNLKWVERVLAHELIHSMDPKISNFDVYKSVKSYDNSGGLDYYTHPFEFDAYTGQFVYSIINAAKRYKGTAQESIVSKYLDDALKYMVNPEKAKEEKTYGFIADPEYWKYYHIYFSHGSPQQKRKMQQRIYKAIMDAKNILSKQLG